MALEPEFPFLNMSIAVYSQTEENNWLNVRTLETRERLGFKDDCGKFVCGLPDKKVPVWGFSGTIVISNILNQQMRCNKEIFTGYEALAFMLSRQLPISSDEAKRILDEARGRRYERFVWVRNSYLYGVSYEQGDFWVILPEYPTEFNRDRFNQYAKGVGSDWRMQTPKTELFQRVKAVEQLKTQIGSETIDI